MSWVVDEWKDGLPAKALQKIREMETKLERLGKDHKQKQFQMDSLEAAYQKQLRKTEEEKNTQVTLKRDNQSLAESCQELERKRERVMHDLQSKEAMVSCLEGKLSHATQLLEAETNRSVQVKNELERVQMEHNNCLQKLEKLTSDHTRLLENFSQQQHRLEGQSSRVKALQKEASKLRDKLDLQEGRTRHYSSGSSASDDEYSTVKQQLKDMEARNMRESARVKELEALLAESKVVSSVPVAVCKSPVIMDLMSFDSPVKPQQKQSMPPPPPPPAASEPTNMAALQDLEKALCDLKKENQALTQENHKLELQVQAKDKELGTLRSQLADSERQLGEVSTSLANMNSALNKQKDETNTVKAQFEKTSSKLEEVERKSKQTVQELECQRHNAEAARQTQEQRLKEREKDHKQELSQQLQTITSLDKELKNANNKHQQEINKLTTERSMLQAQLEKTQFGAQKMEKEISEMKQKLDTAAQSINSHDKTVVQMEKSLKDLKEERENLVCRLDQGNCKISNLESEVVQLKRESQHKEGMVNDLQGKMHQKEKELESLSIKFDKQVKEVNNITENLKLQLSSVETKYSSADALAQKRQHEIEQLTNKLLAAQDASYKFQQQVECSGRDLESLRTEIASLRQHGKELTAALEKAEEAHSKTEWRVEEKDNKILELENQLDVSEKEVESVRSRLAELNAKQENHQQVLDSKKSEIACAKQKLQDMEVSLQHSEAKCAEAVKEIKNEVNHFKMEVGNLEKQLQEQNLEAVKSEEMKTELQDRLHHAEKNLKLKSDEYDTLENQMSAAKNEWEKSLSDAETQLRDLENQNTVQILKLEKELTSKSEEISAKLSEISNLEHSLVNANDHLKFFETRSSHLQDEYNELKIKCDQLESEKLQHDTVVKDKDAELEQQQTLLSQKTSNLETVINTLQQQNNDLHADYRKACNLADNRGSEATDLLNKLEASECEVEKLKERLYRTEADLEIAKTAEQDAKRIGTELSTKVMETEELLQSFKNQLEDTKSELVVLEEKHKDAVSALSEQLTGAEAEVGKKSADISKMVDELTQRKARIEELEQQMAKAALNLENVVALAEASSLEASEMKTQLHLAETELDKTKHNLEKAFKDLSAALNNLDVTQEELESTKEMLSRKSLDNAQLIQEVEALASKLDDATEVLQSTDAQHKKDMAALTERCSQAEATVTSKDEELKEMTCKLEKADLELDTLQEKIGHMAKSHALSEKMVETLKEQAVDHQKLLQETEEKLHILQSEMQQMQVDLEVKAADISGKDEQLVNLKAEISSQSEKSEIIICQKQTLLDDLSLQMISTKEELHRVHAVFSQTENELNKLNQSHLELQEKFDAAEKQLQHRKLILNDKIREVEDLKQKLDETSLEKRKRLEELEVLKLSLTEKLEQSSALIDQKEAEIQVIQAERDTLKRDHEFTCSALLSDASKLHEEISDLRTKLDKVEDLKHATEKELQTTQNILSSTRDENERMLSRLDLIQMDIEDKDTCMEAYTTQIEKMESSIKALEDTKLQNNSVVNDYKRKLCKAQDDLEALGKEREKLQCMLSESEERASHQEEVLEKQTHQQNNNETEIATLNAEVAALKINLADTSTELLKKAAEVESLNGQTENQKQTTDFLKLLLEEKSCAFETLNEKYSEMGRSVQEKDNILEDGQQILKMQREQLEDLQNKLSLRTVDHDTSVKKMTMEVSSLLARLEVSQMDADDRERANQQLTEKLKHKEQLCKQLENRITTMSSELEDLHRTSDELETSKTLLEKALSNVENENKAASEKKDAVISDLRQTSGALQKEKSVLESELQKAQFSLENTAEDMDSMTEQFQELSEKYQQLQQYNQELVSSHSQLKTEFDMVVCQKDALHQTNQHLENELEDAKVSLQHVTADGETERWTMQEKLQSLTNDFIQLQKTHNETLTRLSDTSREEQLAKARVQQLELETAEKLTNSVSPVTALKERVACLQEELASAEKTLQETNEKFLEEKRSHLQLQKTLKVEQENQALHLIEQTQKQTDVETNFTDTLRKLEEAKNSLEASRQSLSILEASKEALVADFQALSKKSSQQEKTIITQGNQICDLEQVICEKDAQLETLKTHVDETEDQLSHSQKDYKRELAENRKDICSLHEEIAQLRDTLELKEHALKMEANKLQEKEEEFEELQEKSKCEANIIRLQLEKLENELKAAQQKHAEDSHLTDGLTSQVSQLTLQLEGEKETHERKEFEIIEREAHAQDNNESLMREISELKDCISAKDDLITFQEKSVEEMKEKLSQGDKAVAQAQERINTNTQSFQSEMCALEEHLRSKTELNDQLERELESLKTSLVEEKSCLLEALAETEEKLEQDKKNLSNEVAVLNCKLEALEQENKEALVLERKHSSQLREDLEKFRQASRSQTELAEHTLASLKDEKLQLETALEEMRHSADGQLKELERVQNVSDERNRRLQSSVERIEILQTELREQRDLVALADKENAQVREELECRIGHLEKQVGNLSDTVDVKQCEIDTLLEVKNDTVQELVSLKHILMEGNNVSEGLREELVVKLERVQDEKDIAESRVSDLLEQLHSSKKAEEESRYQLNVVKREFEAQGWSSEEQNARLDTVVAENEKLKTERSRAQEESSQLHHEWDSAAIKLDTFQVESEQYQARVNELLEQLDTTEEQRRSLQLRIESQEHEMQKVQEMCTSLQWEREESLFVVQSLQEEKNDFISKNDKLAHELGSIQESLKVSQEQKAQLQDKNASLFENVEHLELALDKLREEITKENVAKLDSLEQVKISSGNVSCLQTKVMDLEVHINRLETEKEEAISLFNKAAEHLTATQQECQDNRNALSSLQIQKTDLEKQLETMISQIRDSEEEMQVLRQNFTKEIEEKKALGEELKLQQGELTEIKTRCTELECDISTMESAHGEKEQQLAESESAVAKQADKISELTELLMDAKAVKQEVERQQTTVISEMKQEVLSITKERDELLAANEEIINKTSVLENETAELKIQLDVQQAESTQKIETLTHEVSQLMIEKNLAEEMMDSMKSYKAMDSFEKDELEEQIKLKVREIEERDARILDLRSSVERTEKEMSELEEALHTSQRNLEEANNDNWEVTESLQDKLSELDSAEGKISTLSENIKMLESEKEQIFRTLKESEALYQDEVSNLTGELQVVTEKLDQISSEKVHIQGRNKDLSSDLNNLESRFTQVTSEYQTIKTERDEAKDRLKTAETELRDNKELAKELEHQLKSLKNLHQKMEQGTEEEVSALSREVSNLQEQLRQLSHSYQSTQEENIKLTAEKNLVEAENNNLKDRLGCLEAEKENLKLSRMEYADQVRSMEYECSEKSRMLDQLKVQLQETERSKHNIKEQLNGIQDQALLFEAERAHLESKSKSLQSENKVMAEQITLLTSENAKLESLSVQFQESNSAMEAEVCYLRSQLDEDIKHCRILEKALAGTEKDMKQKIEMMNFELEGTKKLLESRDAEIESEKLRMEAINNEKTALEKSLQEKHVGLLKAQASLKMEAEQFERRIMGLEEESSEKAAEVQKEYEKKFANLEEKLTAEKVQSEVSLASTIIQLQELQAKSAQQEEKILEQKAECEQFKLSAQKANQAMKTMSIKLKQAEQDPSPSKKQQDDLRKAEAQLVKFRGQLVEESSSRSRAEENLEKAKIQQENSLKENVTRLEELTRNSKELQKDKESLQGKLQFAINNSRRMEKDLSNLQRLFAELEAENEKLKSSMQGRSGQQTESGGSSGVSRTVEELQKKLSEKDEESLALKELAKSNEMEANQALKKYAQLITRYQKLESAHEILQSKAKAYFNMAKAAKTNKPGEVHASSAKVVEPTQSHCVPTTAINKSTVQSNSSTSHTTTPVVQHQTRPPPAQKPAQEPTTEVQPAKTPSPLGRRTRLSTRKRSTNNDTEPKVLPTVKISPLIKVNNLEPLVTDSTTDKPKVSVPNDQEADNLSHIRVRVGKRPLNTPVKPLETKRIRHLSSHEESQQGQTGEPAGCKPKATRLTTRSRLRPPMASRITRSQNFQEHKLEQSNVGRLTVAATTTAAATASSSSSSSSSGHDGGQQGFNFRPSSQVEALPQRVTRSQQATSETTAPPAALGTITNSPRKLQSTTAEPSKQHRFGRARCSLSLKKSPDQKKKQPAADTAKNEEENCQVQ